MLRIAPFVLIALAPFAGAQEEQDPAELVEAALVRLDESGDVDAAATELAELGPIAVPAIFDRYVGARGKRKPALLQALERAPSASVTAAISAAVDASPPPGPDEGLQRASLLVLQQVGGARDFELCLKAAKVLGEETFAPRTSELTAALDAIFERDPGLLQYVEHGWLTIEKRLRTPVARSVGNLGGDPAIEFLTGLLARDDANCGMLLSQLGRASRGISLGVAERTADVARPYLGHEAEGVVKETAVLLARLEDDAAIPELIPLLAHESSGVTGNVYWALKQLTGLALPQDEGAWAAWHQRESEWWAHESRRVFRDLTNRDPAVAGAAIRDVAGHRLARHALARELTVALVHHQPQVRRDAIAGLVRIGSRAAVQALTDALLDRDRNVVADARQALVQLTGVDPLPDSDVETVARR